jgi:hypothetical protein
VPWRRIATESWIDLQPGGARGTPIASFSDGYGKMHLIIDDHQVVLLRSEDDVAKATSWWPPEIVMEAARLCKDMPRILIQFRPRDAGEDALWMDNSNEFFAVFSHERHLAEERVKELNKIDSHYEYRIKPEDR